MYNATAPSIFVNLYNTTMRFLCLYTKCSDSEYFLSKPLDKYSNLEYNVDTG